MPVAQQLGAVIQVLPGCIGLAQTCYPMRRERLRKFVAWPGESPFRVHVRFRSLGARTRVAGKQVTGSASI